MVCERVRDIFGEIDLRNLGRRGFFFVWIDEVWGFEGNSLIERIVGVGGFLGLYGCLDLVLFEVGFWIN